MGFWTDSSFSPENAAIIDRLYPDFDARDTGSNQIEELMNAAREEGRRSALNDDA